MGLTVVASATIPQYPRGPAGRDQTPPGESESKRNCSSRAAGAAQSRWAWILIHSMFSSGATEHERAATGQRTNENNPAQRDYSLIFRINSSLVLMALPLRPPQTELPSCQRKLASRIGRSADVSFKPWIPAYAGMTT